jgi:2-amino-4-hydroxy-6-hydroxymethyldihydropteridine diphosphokinase
MIVYLSLGSNVGDRLENLQRACRMLCGAGIALRRTSSVYETEPVDKTDQEWFLNAVVEIVTTLPPLKLLQRIQEIEGKLGRQRTIAKGPRTLDIDILLYGGLVMNTPEMMLPHPRMMQRRFVLEPLRELAPSLTIPGTGKTVQQAYDELRDPAQVRLLIKTLCA